MEKYFMKLTKFYLSSKSYRYLDAVISCISLPPVPVFGNLRKISLWAKGLWFFSEIVTLPLADNFLVLMILAANSKPVFFCTHLRTTEKAPLKWQNNTLISRKIDQISHTKIWPKLDLQNCSTNLNLTHYTVGNTVWFTIYINFSR